MARFLFGTQRLFAQERLCSRGVFNFDGKNLCGKLLSDELYFSGDTLHLVLKSNDRSNDARYVTLESFSSSTLDISWESPGLIISFLESVADSSAYLMPDRNEQHAPCFLKIGVYEEFNAEFNILFTNTKAPNYSYFSSVRQKYCPTIKV